MQNLISYSWPEAIALVFSVLIGSGAYLGFMVLKKNQPIKLKFIFWVLVINLFVTYIFSELLKAQNWGAYRTIILPLVAYGGQNFMEWFDKRSFKLFDAAAKKVGIDVNDDNTNSPKDETENIQDRSPQ